jgi:HAD superfamily hydrolase (TIGR01484 family)
MLYEAIIFDLDGTAMPSAEDTTPSAKMISATKSFKDKTHLCAATGRSWKMAKDIILALGLTDPCIVSGGAVIMDPLKQEILWQETINEDSLSQILKVAQEYDYRFVYATGLTTSAKQPDEISSLPAETNTIYIMRVGADKAAQVLKDLSGIDHITITKAISWELNNSIDIHITNAKATKEHAVIELCRILGVNPVNTAGVGDGFNDVHLFNSVGHKIAMGNAVPELKELADKVIDTIDNDGLAKFIESSIKLGV